jgi:ubiquinone/menaquinone biosynthesis C-methylase UbiE
VLGTHDDEIARLGLQHRLWKPRVDDAWRRAGFAAGQTLLDIGCGPGWATLELATLVGPTGRAIGIERSRRFLDAAAALATERDVTNCEWHEHDLDHGELPVRDADGAWTRWVYAFVQDPRGLLARTARALRPGGVLVVHEYVDYRSWQLVPEREEFEWFVREVMASWREHGGEPDIARRLPAWLAEAGLELREMRAITEAARPSDPLWAWPDAFVRVGLQRLVDLGRVDAARAEQVWGAFRESQSSPGAFLLTPAVLEIVAVRR